MTDRRSDPGFTVAPRPLGDRPRGRGRGPRRGRFVGIAVVVGGAAAVVVIALLGPRLSGRPNLDLAFFATPTPLRTPTPVPSRDPTPIPTPTVTPLPEITRPDGGGPAAGRVAIAADGLRFLDLGSGALERGIELNPGRDALVRAADGSGWICLCFTEDLSGETPVRRVQVVAMDEVGAVQRVDDVATLSVTFDPEDGGDNPATDVDIRTDGRSGLLTSATRVGDAWQFDVSAIDIARRRAGPTVKLGIASPAAARPGPKPSPGPAGPPSPDTGPTPEPSPDAATSFYLDGPHIRIAPGGRVAFVWGTIQESGETVVATTVHAWRVALDESGRIGAVRPIAGLAALPMGCGGVGFGAEDRLAWLCPQFPSDPNEPLTSWQVGAIDLDGRLTGTADIAVVADGFYSEPLFDRANGTLYAWDPLNLSVTRFDIRTLDATTVSFDPAAESGPGVAPVGGEPPVWRDSDSAVQMYSYNQSAGARNGSRLYFLGFNRSPDPDSGNLGSLGIFVVDRATLALVDRWAPAANYIAISAMPNGQVLGVGLPGVEADGHTAPWQGSLTVHDPSDGRILIRYGQLGQESPPLVFDR